MLKLRSNLLPRGPRVVRLTRLPKYSRTTVKAAAERSQSQNEKLPANSKRRRKGLKEKNSLPHENNSPVVLSLADLAYGQPPWELSKEALLVDIGLERFLGSTVPCAKDGRSLHVALRVEPVGEGFYLRGRASATVGVSCSVCSVCCDFDVDTPFEAWLSRTERRDDDLAADEVPWPLHERAVDLTEMVSAAVSEALPPNTRCRKRSCRDAPSQWSTDANRSGRDGSIGKGSAFSQLARLRDDLK